MEPCAKLKLALTNLENRVLKLQGLINCYLCPSQDAAISLF